MYTISGTVKDVNGNPLIRKVFLLDKNTLSVLDTTYSKLDGSFQFKQYTSDQRMVVIKSEGIDASNSVVLDSITPIYDGVPNPSTLDTIGVPGSVGFGVGYCKDVPSTLTPLPGHNDPYSENYGNYKVVSDGSIMVWVPKFYYKWGTGSNGLALNECDIKGTDTYANETAANADGYALHRAFIDGGVIKDGFFIDKFLCCKHPTLNVASSLPMMVPTNSSRYSTDFGSTNRIGYGIEIAKLRGSGFHITTGFMWSAIALLSYSHGRSAGSTTNCAWYGTTQNFPRVNDTNSATSTCCSFDSSVYILRGSAANLSWSSQANEKFTHNGQKCGISDIGNLWDSAVGLTVISSTFYCLKESVSIKNLELGSGANGVQNSSNYDSLGSTLSDYSTTNGWIYGVPGSQTFCEDISRSSNNYKYTNLGIMKPSGWSATDPKYYGGGTYRRKVSDLMLNCGGSWNDQGNTGRFGLSLYYSWTDSNPFFGFRAALYNT